MANLSSTGAQRLPPLVSDVTSTFLDRVDAEMPGRVEGLYLVGSVAHDDFHPDCSDVDFVAVSETRPSDAALTVLAAAHAHVRERYRGLDFEGTHLSWTDLALDPSVCTPAPFCYEGKFDRSGTFALNPITWYELRNHARPVRGPALLPTQVWHDDAVLRAWTVGNLQGYWTRWLNRYRTSSSPERFADDPVTWGVLGVARLHYTLATARITSKTAGGRYALNLFPARWTRIVTEALRIRAQPQATTTYTDTSERHSDAADFVNFTITEALRMIPQ